MPRPETTDFGYERVPHAEKSARVRKVFESVADRYDLMNDLMSAGLHRLWKRFAVDLVAPRAGERILDLAGGTGDMTALMAPRAGEVVFTDVNAAMLERGRARLIDAGLAGRVEFAQANAESLPFPDGGFDAVTIAFGLRNVTDKDAALREMARVLKPGGRAVVLEFSRPSSAIAPLYDRYSFTVLPALGRLVAKDEASYRYLAESIRMHPGQETLMAMMEAAGFERCGYYNLAGGIVAAHRGYRL